MKQMQVTNESLHHSEANKAAMTCGRCVKRFSITKKKKKKNGQG